MPSVTAKTRSAAAAHGAARAIHAATAPVSNDRIMLGGFLARKTQGQGRHRALRMRADNRTTTRLSVRLRVTRRISHRGWLSSAVSRLCVDLFHKAWTAHACCCGAQKAFSPIADPLIARLTASGVAARSYPRHTETPRFHRRLIRS